MESIPIVAGRRYDEALKARLTNNLCAQPSGAQNIIVLDDGKSRIYVARNECATQEMDATKIEYIRQLIGDPHFYVLDYSDIDFCKSVLLLLVDDPLLFVDNDHGLVLPGSEFVQLIRLRPEWDWRGDFVS